MQHFFWHGKSVSVFSRLTKPGLCGTNVLEIKTFCKMENVRGAAIFKRDSTYCCYDVSHIISQQGTSVG